jgi:uncharacterized delta-60 repeat protein
MRTLFRFTLFLPTTLAIFLGASLPGEAKAVVVKRTLSKYANDAQVGTVNAPLQKNFQVKVVDSNSVPVNNLVVTWKVVKGAGSFPGKIKTTTSKTDSDGFAVSPLLTLGAAVGLNTVSATIAGKGVVSVLFSATGKALSQKSGDFDKTFNGSGLVTIIRPTGLYFEGGSLSIDPVGKIVATIPATSAGVAGPATAVIGRYLANGAVDTTFNGGLVANKTGLVQISLPGSLSFSTVDRTAFTSSGNLLIGGRYSDKTMVMNLTSTGALNNTFGAQGYLLQDRDPIGYDTTQLWDLPKTANSDEKILVGNLGTIKRYSINGAIDQSFSMLNLETITDHFLSLNLMAIDSNNRIVMGGIIEDFQNGQTSTHWSVYLARLSGDGTLDKTFGDNGTKIIPFESTYFNGKNITSTASALAIDPVDGTIVLGGNTTNSNYDSEFAVVVRFTTNGQLDKSFNQTGIARFGAVGTYQMLRSLVITPQHKIIFGGEQALQYQLYSMFLTRLNSDGSLDNTFGVNGQVIKQINNDNSGITQITLDAQGKIIVFGYYDFETFIARVIP